MEKIKVCSSCKSKKPLSEFYKSGQTKNNGYRYSCKTCCNSKETIRNRTVKGLVNVIYKSQRCSSKNRNHPMPNYTKEYLFQWLTDQELFQTLYDNWVESGYLKELKPSVDRINDSKPYTPENIVLTIWETNLSRCHENMRNGNYGNTLQPIVQFDINDNFIKEFISINEAVRETGLAQGNLWKVLNGIGKSLNNYKWKYKSQI